MIPRKSIPPLNMKVLRKTRKFPEQGDIFVYKIDDNGYRWGRVIKNDLRMMDFQNVILVYFYNVITKDKEIPKLNKDSLLIPPTLLSKWPWSRGYFEKIVNAPLEKEDVLSTHYFRDLAFKVCRNEKGEVLPNCIEFSDIYAIGNDTTIDRMLSKRLGLWVPDGWK